jgi:hypothetical protein
MIYYFPDGKFSASHFARSLIEMVEKNTCPEEIGKWTYSIFHQYKVSEVIEDKLMSLIVMEEGKEFELSKEEILQIANELINLENGN